MISERQNHRCKIKLRTRNIWDIDSRVVEINQLRAWLDELTEWQPEAYTMRFVMKDSMVDVWFKQEQHAVACALKWS